MIPKEVTGLWVEAFNRRDADALAPLYHADATNHQVAAGEPAVGRDARAFFRAFPDNFTGVEGLYQDCVGGEPHDRDVLPCVDG